MFHMSLPQLFHLSGVNKIDSDFQSQGMGLQWRVGQKSLRTWKVMLSSRADQPPGGGLKRSLGGVLRNKYLSDCSKKPGYTHDIAQSVRIKWIRIKCNRYGHVMLETLGLPPASLPAVQVSLEYIETGSILTYIQLWQVLLLDIWNAGTPKGSSLCRSNGENPRVLSVPDGCSSGC